MLPYLNETQKYKTDISQFDGYDHRPRISENCFFDSSNLTSDAYPFIKTRPKRGTKIITTSGFVKDILAVNGKNDELVYLTKTHGASYRLTLVWGETISNLFNSTYEDTRNRTLISMGKTVLLFPEGYAFTKNGENITREFIAADARSDYGDNVLLLELGIVTDGKFEALTCANGAVINTDPDDGVGIFHSELSDITASTVIRITDKYLDRLLTALEDRDRFSENANIKDYITASLAGLPWISRKEENVGKTYFDFSTLRKLGDGSVVFNGAMYAYSVRITNGDHAIFTKYEITTGTEYEATEKLENKAYIEYKDALRPPQMDFVVECQNRLWGCYCGPSDDGKTEINEIYCTALGSYSEWERYEGIASDSWRASLGTFGKFTGAATISDTPIFFKENSIHKIYISSTGAHRIVTLEEHGIEPGSSQSIALIDNLLYYKGRNDVFVFDGTTATPISDKLGREKYTDAAGGAFKDKYVLYMKDRDEKQHIFTYDTRLGIWQNEYFTSTEPIRFAEPHNGNLILTHTNELIEFEAENFTPESSPVAYMAETGEYGYESVDERYLCRLDIRVKLEFGAHFNVWIQYDQNGKWLSLTRLVGDTVAPTVRTVNVMPHRCELFKIRITGTGDVTIYNIRKIYEMLEK